MSGFRRVTPTVDTFSSFPLKCSLNCSANCSPFMSSRVRSISLECLFMSLSLTQPPATRTTVLSYLALRKSRTIVKISCSRGVITILEFFYMQYLASLRNNILLMPTCLLIEISGREIINPLLIFHAYQWHQRTKARIRNTPSPGASCASGRSSSSEAPVSSGDSRECNLSHTQTQELENRTLQAQ